ncbi:hypothetical protein AVEN_134956-1 [Araneus ventricosus]|uniref:Uncharacterized protein n=1 Tax=Araneus ventricosus TaxID=182803 RepID=A0A4Y2CJ07_ARAVE|nr:hypothetical protein AVEN_134956-1 [Araneus ventricosus]
MSSINRTAARQGSSHIVQSIVNFLEKIEQEMGTKTVSFTDNPAKSPDVSRHGFLRFWTFKMPFIQTSTYNPLWTWESCSRGMEQNTSPNTTTGIIIREGTS